MLFTGIEGYLAKFFEQLLKREARFTSARACRFVVFFELRPCVNLERLHQPFDIRN
nr:MAG TPA: hypothetical protein [Caudoviricetes sp.]